MQGPNDNLACNREQPFQLGQRRTQIGPGTTVYLCGTLTGPTGGPYYGFQFQGSGTSGNPITLKFDTGAILQANAGGTFNQGGGFGTGMIDANSQSYLVIDGQNSGIVQNLLNGSSGQTCLGGSCTLQDASLGVNLNGNNLTLQNLTIKAIYFNCGSSSSCSDSNGLNTAAVNVSGSNITINHDTLQTASTIVNGTGAGAIVSNNTISDGHWMFGAVCANCTVNFFGNDVSNWTNWQFPSIAYHTDGIIAFSSGGSGNKVTVNSYNNYYHGDLGVGSPTAFIFCTDNGAGDNSGSSCNSFNDVIIGTGNSATGGWLIALGDNVNQIETPMTFYNDYLQGGQNQIVSEGSSSSDFWTIKNTIGVADRQYGMVMVSNGGVPCGNITSDHNVWYNSYPAGGVNFGCSGNTYSFSQWQALGEDTHSSTGNPDINSSAPPYTLMAGSAGIGLGANLTGLGIAALDTGAPQTFGAGGSCGTGCVARPNTGPWDSGAYQFAAGNNHTFYIDNSATGCSGSGCSDLNNGTSKTTAWAHLPGMASWTGSHTPVSDDTFILRGCDVWTSADLPVLWNWSGSSGSPITIGGEDRRGTTRVIVHQGGIVRC